MNLRRYASAIRTENVPKKGNATHSTQLVFDVNGGVVFSKVLAVGTGRRELSRDAMWISATLADRLLRIETERCVPSRVGDCAHCGLCVCVVLYVRMYTDSAVVVLCITCCCCCQCNPKPYTGEFGIEFHVVTFVMFLVTIS